jgi:hypothetical protein
MRSQQQADALVLLAETALHQELDPGAPGERYQVVVHVDAAVLEDPGHEGQTALEGGIRVSAETSRRLACDASRARGGPTTLSNLVSLCRRHHRAVHEEGYQVARNPDDTFQFRRPDGRELPDVPPPAAVPADPVGAVRAENEARQVRISARTACARWLGERLDLGCAIDVLHPLAAPAGLGATAPAPLRR